MCEKCGSAIRTSDFGLCEYCSAALCDRCWKRDPKCATCSHDGPPNYDDPSCDLPDLPQFGDEDITKEFDIERVTEKIPWGSLNEEDFNFIAYDSGRKK